MKSFKFIVLSITALALISSIGVFILYNRTFGRFWVTTRTIDKRLDDKIKVIQIEIDEEAQHPHKIDISFKGNLNGKAIIGYGWADTSMYIIDTVENDFELDYQTDWYSDVCLVTYTPINSTNGRIEVNCKIYSGKK